MNFLELCEKRYSVRKYSAEAVSDDDLRYVLECARMAQSAVNFQPWKFVVVRSEAARPISGDATTASGLPRRRYI